MLNQAADAANKGANAWASGLVLVAGLLGAGGVTAAALAAHGKGGLDLSIAAQYLILHAAAICALAMPGPRARRGFLTSATLLALGTLLFCGDLSSRALLGSRLFFMAAPSGGMILIVGWLAVSVAAALNLARRSKH
jgi:uncharacterized membrane protein YgdD (TMEM256/DUF423 family)